MARLPSKGPVGWFAPLCAAGWLVLCGMSIADEIWTAALSQAGLALALLEIDYWQRKAIKPAPTEGVGETPHPEGGQT